MSMYDSNLRQSEMGVSTSPAMGTFKTANSLGGMKHSTQGLKVGSKPFVPKIRVGAGLGKVVGRKKGI